MKLVCIGDSLTYGYGVNKEKCWVSLLQNDMNFQVINRGMNGDTSAGLLMRIYEDIIETKASHAVIMAGTNDMLLNYSIKQLQKNIILIVRELLENNIVPILAIQPPIVNHLAERLWDSYIDYDRVKVELQEYRLWAKEFAEIEDIRVIDFYEEFIGQSDQCSFYTDGIHLNESGNRLVYEMIRKEFAISSLKNNGIYEAHLG